MNVRRFLLLGLVCIMPVAPLAAQEEPAGKKAGDKAQMSEEMQAQMEAWMALAQPGPEHKNLEYMVGDWNARVEHWMEPGAEAMVDQGWCHNEPMLGGRFIRTEFKGKFMDMQFEGVGWTGFDRMQKKYISIWADNFGTMVLVSQGVYDEAKKEYTYVGEYKMAPDQIMKQKMHIKVISPNKHVMTMYQSMPDSDEMFKVMEITYTRARTDEDAHRPTKE